MERHKTDSNGLYKVSNLGNIKSLSRVAWNGCKYRTIPEKIIKQRKWKNRYYQVKLSKNGKIYTCYVHRLVGEAFIDGYCEGLVINHKDNNGFNNKYTNLEWVTQKENMIHAWKNNLCENARNAARNSKGRVPREVIRYDEHKRILKVYGSVREASNDLKVNEHTIRNAIRRESKKYNLKWRNYNGSQNTLP